MQIVLWINQATNRNFLVIIYLIPRGFKPSTPVLGGDDSNHSDIAICFRSTVALHSFRLKLCSGKYIVYCTVFTVYCTLCTLQCTVYNEQCRLYTKDCILLPQSLLHHPLAFYNVLQQVAALLLHLVALVQFQSLLLSPVDFRSNYKNQGP